MDKKLISFGIILLALVGIGTLLVPRSKNTPTTQSPKLQIIASFYPMAFFAEQIAGDNANVTNVTPAGAEPHDYEPSTQDIAQMEHASLIILNGNVEPWGDKIKTNLKNSSIKIITAGEGLATRTLTENDITSADPHVWLDPVLAKQEVRKISDAIIQIDPANKNLYTTNTNAVLQKLDQLDNTYKTGLASCTTKDIITSHAAFGYLAQQYGLNQLAIAGLSPDEEPSAQALIATAKFVQEHNVKYIFFESLVSPKLSQTIANETGAQTLELNPLEGLTKDQQQQGEDYFTVMYNNLHNLQTALSCTM
ncbi:MAG: zinc ABC transporter substrate-binding protein [Candidatus Andersenbacteria bacterium]|nr:zinc ABC transporter substrate-binding protein [Candidatus Andersenbacteria bacterium]